MAIVRDIYNSGVKTNLGVAEGITIPTGKFISLDADGFVIEATENSYVHGYSIQESMEDPSFEDPTDGYRTVECVVNGTVICKKHTDIDESDIGHLVYCKDSVTVKSTPAGTEGANPVGLLLKIDKSGYVIVDMKTKALS